MYHTYATYKYVTYQSFLRELFTNNNWLDGKKTKRLQEVLENLMEHNMLENYTAWKLLVFRVSAPYFTALGLNKEGYSPYSVQMRENTDQENSKYGHFSRSVGKGQLMKKTAS